MISAGLLTFSIPANSTFVVNQGEPCDKTLDDFSYHTLTGFCDKDSDYLVGYGLKVHNASGETYEADYYGEG